MSSGGTHGTMKEHDAMFGRELSEGTTSADSVGAGGRNDNRVSPAPSLASTSTSHAWQIQGWGEVIIVGLAMLALVAASTMD
jgi:hypothetical protein